MAEKISVATNAINWFEIPVTDLERARKFYERILDVSLHSMNMEGMEMLMFPSGADGNGKVGGGLVKSEYHIPGMTGTIIYLNANPRIQDVLDRVEDAGGEVTMPRTLIDEQTGYMAFFNDTEGNRLGLHAGN